MANLNNNPHLRAELKRNSAPDRFEAGPQSVKAARIESSSGPAVWEVLRQWKSTESMERFRPPPVIAHNIYNTRDSYSQIWLTTGERTRVRPTFLSSRGPEWNFGPYVSAQGPWRWRSE